MTRFGLIRTFILCSLLTGQSALAASPRDYLQDLGAYAQAPLHWDAQDWRYIGASAAAVAAAYSLDERGRDHFADGGVPAGQDPHAWRDAAPLLALTAGTFAIGKLRHDDTTAEIGLDMAEASVLGALSATVLKVAAGRARPNETSSRSSWRDGGDSFPSGHVTIAFAAAEVFADRLPREQWGWRALAYGLAGVTAYARLDGNVHWLSDTVAGAALGIATGRFIAGRGETRQPSRVAMSVVPLQGGAMIEWHLRTD